MDQPKRNIDAELKAFNLVYYANTLMRGMAKIGSKASPQATEEKQTPKEDTHE